MAYEFVLTAEVHDYVPAFTEQPSGDPEDVVEDTPQDSLSGADAFDWSEDQALAETPEPGGIDAFEQSLLTVLQTGETEMFDAPFMSEDGTVNFDLWYSVSLLENDLIANGVDPSQYGEVASSWFMGT